MTPSALFSPAPFGAGPAIVLTEIAFQSVITAGSAAAGGWVAEAGSAAVNATPTATAASTAVKPIRLRVRNCITPPCWLAIDKQRGEEKAEGTRPSEARLVGSLAWADATPESSASQAPAQIVRLTFAAPTGCFQPPAA